jgi:hypothetical protein
MSTPGAAAPLPLYGLVAEFTTPEEILEATRRARQAGYQALEAYTPFPVDLEEMPPMCRPVRFADNHVRMHRWFALSERNITHQCQDFHLLGERDALIILLFPIAIAHSDIARDRAQERLACRHPQSSRLPVSTPTPSKDAVVRRDGGRGASTCRI